MVYESDFYTTRRPYTRPTVTSYSVTRREVPWHKVPLVPRPSQVAPCFTVFGTRSTPKEHGLKLPGLGKGQTFHHNIPIVAHKRIVTVIPSAHNVRSKQSVLLSEIDRIQHKVRPCLSYQPTEDYLNSRSMVSFDDETRSIRAKTAELLKRIHTPIPRAQRPMPLPGDAYYSHTELPITDRITSDNYIDRLLSANKEVAHDIVNMSHYEEPAKKYNSIGRGHLACVSFAGGRPILKRRNLANDYIRDDINVLSHYGRFRAAAAAGNTVMPTETDYHQPTMHRPPTKSSVTGSWKSNAPRQPKESSKQLTAGEQFDEAQDRKQRRRDAVEAAAQREVEEEKRRKGELARQENLAQQAVIERQEELERKAREEEEALKLKEEEEKREAERQAQEAERLAIEEEERLLREEEERILREEEEKKKREEEEKKAKKAKKEAEKKAKEEAERKAKEEEENKKKEEAERKAKEEEEKRKKEEEERKAKEEAERLAKEEEERKAREEAERKAKEEEELLAKEEAEKKAREEAENLAKEEAERLAKEEEERLAQDQTEEKEQKLSEDNQGTEDAEEPESAQVQQEPAEVSVEPQTEEESQPVVEEPAEETKPASADETEEQENNEEDGENEE